MEGDTHLGVLGDMGLKGFTLWRAILLASLGVAVLSLAACGGGGGGGSKRRGGAPTPVYLVGGTVTGLTGSGLQLLLNNNEALGIDANGEFTFATPVPNGGGYAVTVHIQPASPSQYCAVTDGIGTVSGGPVASVVVTCGGSPPSGTPSHTVSANVSGLLGSGLKLQLNGAQVLSVSANGVQTFANPVPDGGGYVVTVLTQPTDPQQNCVITNGIGTVSGANISVPVVCNPPNTYTVGGTVVGLVGSGLSLNLNGTETLPIVGSGPFTFASALNTGDSFTVTVAAAPGAPAQSCSVSNGSGTLATVNVTGVLVVCNPPSTFTVGGTVSGLAGGGLQLSLNGGSPLSIADNGGFTFATPLQDGAAFTVSITADPGEPAQSCTVSGGSGTVNGANVATVSVTCAAPATFPVGGAVSGLVGSGLRLQLNGSSSLAVAGNGPFQFPAAVSDGGAYAVTVLTQPSGPVQSCSVSGGANGNGTGTVAGAAVASIAVTCNPPNTYTVGGTVSGLVGTGLVLGLNGTETLPVLANGTFTFTTALVNAAAYAVTVSTNPGTPAQTCSVSNGTGSIGTASVTQVVVSCAAPANYTVGGAVSGLVGSGLQLLLNGGSALSTTSNGLFTFATPVQDGSAYAVTVATHPASPAQTCSVSAGTGTVSGSNVGSVSVTCAPPASYLVGGTVSGLVGGGLQLKLNASPPLNVGANGGFQFAAAPVVDGSIYAVSVQTQPLAPIQSCTVSGGGNGNGTGTILGANVGSIVVTCAPPTAYTVGGQVLGLVGSGLSLALNGGETLPVSADGVFTFTTTLVNAEPYAVTVATPPGAPAQSCAVTNGSGSMGTANVTSVLVVCSPPASYTVGGTVSGLVGSGLQLLLNGGSALSVSANGAFTFTSPIQDGAAYAVTVAASPATPAQTCSVGNGAGTVNAASVTSVSITCSAPASYLIGGTVTGLVGSGLNLQLNGSAQLGIAADGTFQFSAAPVVDAGAYVVTVQTQPTVPAQSCVVTNGSGTVSGGNVTSVSVTCNPPGSFTVGGTVTGLAGSGQGLTLQNGVEILSVAANGSFTFATAVVDAGTYSVTVQTQPSVPAQTCTVSSGSGTIVTANVTSVAVACAPPAQYTVGGMVTGLTGSGLKLRLNGAIDLDVSGDGSFTFGSTVVDAGAYSVVVQTQPAAPNQFCSVTGGSGTVSGANVTTVDVVCSAGFTVGGNLSGLLGGNSITLLSNGGNATVLSADGAFTFSTPVGVLQTYTVTISVSPAPVPQQCSVTNGSGIITASNVTNVQVTCSTSTAYTVGGTLSGLSGSGLVLENNGGDALPITANGAFTFVTALFNGSPYAVTIATAPATPAQTCNVTSGSGTISGANVTSVSVSCSTNSYSIGGPLSGLTGSITLQNNGGDDLVLTGDGSFTFATLLADLNAYAVTVSSQPAGQFCSVSNGTGNLAGANLTTVGVVCHTLYTIGGTVAGLSGTGLVLRNNGSDDLPIGANGSFTFATTIPDGSTYAVTVATPPGTPSQTCTVTGGGSGDGTGTAGGAAVTDILVTCITNTYTVGGTVNGLMGTDLVIRKNGASTLMIGANGPFTFPSAQADLTSYSVTVAANPINPLQPCTVTNGSGTLAGADVTNVQVDCLVNPPTVATPLQSLGARPSFTPFTLDLSGTFTDTEDPPANLALSVESVNPAGVVDAAFDPGTQNLRLTYVYGGWYDGVPVTVTVKATDSTLAAVTSSFPLVIVPAAYENGANWNEYVVNDGADVYNASGAACAGTETGGFGACIHGGEARSMPVPGYSACTGLTATDALDAFYWTCNVHGGQAYMETRALKPGRGLADLIDWSATPVWLEDSLTVTDGGSFNWTSTSRQWWGNPVQEVSAGTVSGVANAPGWIYAVTARPTAGVNFTLSADEVALVVKPGLALQGSGTGGSLVSATGVKFGWVEGSFNGAPPSGTSNSNGLAWSNVAFSVARKVKVWNGALGAGGIAGINLSGGGNNRLTEVLVANMSGAATVRGVWLQGATTDNTLSDVTAFNNQGAGVEVTGSSNNRLLNITSFANGSRGVYLPFTGTTNSSSNLLFNVTAVNNGSDGVSLVGVSGTNLANQNTVMNVATANNGSAGTVYGFVMQNQTGFVVQNVASVSNRSRDVRLSGGAVIVSGVLKTTDTTGIGRCSVPSGTGLTNTNCTVSGTYGSTTTGGAVFHKFLSVPNTFRDAVLSDTVNTSENGSGQAAYGTGIDWIGFENTFRGWGLAVGTGFPILAERGRCGAGTCQVWDWSLALGDLGDLGADGAAGGAGNNADRPVLLGEVSLPDGNSAVTHTWTGGGTVTLLLNAFEARDRTTGNNDGICESGEICLFTPNIGAYQGHGTLQPGGAFVDGTLTGIQLLEWSANGY